MIKTIVSGGQTGADRAALDFALKYGFPIKGYCPLGRKAEDGPLDIKYPLVETESSAYPARTQKNILIADATVIFNGLPTNSAGTRTTIKYAREHRKKYLLLRGFPDVDQDVIALKAWLQKIRPKTLNIAGNGEGKCHGMHQHVYNVLKKALLMKPEDSVMSHEKHENIF